MEIIHGVGGYGILATLIIGLIIGCIANQVMGQGKLGLLWSIALGLVGSMVGGIVFSLVGISVYGLLGHIISGVAGACLVLFLARKMKSA